MDPFALGDGEDPDIRAAGGLLGDPYSADTAYSGLGGPEDHLFMYDDGRVWDLGPADVDTDDDGVKDSLTRTGPDGLTVYTDRDNDGRVDAVTRIGPDGSYAAHVLDGDSGRWVPTDSGRLK